MQDQYPSSNASLFASAARGQRFFKEISPAELYEAYKHDPDMIAVVDVYGFERLPCVQVRGTNDVQIAILHPRYPSAWAKDFNAIVAHQKSMQPICTGKDPIRCDDKNCPVHGGK